MRTEKMASLPKPDIYQLQWGQQRVNRPLMMICRTPNGKERPMTVRECATTGSTYIHVAADDLDALLARELGGK